MNNLGCRSIDMLMIVVIDENNERISDNSYFFLSREDVGVRCFIQVVIEEIFSSHPVRQM